MEIVIKNVQFVKSIVDLKQKPPEKHPEIAFAGRSNVGKSSLLNALFNRKRLVKTSSTPGKTQLINYFQVNDSHYFVDLPGYGFAKIPKSVSIKWQKMLEDYFLKSDDLQLVCLLIDSRHDLLKPDEQMADWLNYKSIPYIIILTKTDKINRNKLTQQIKYFTNKFPDHHVIPFSVNSEQSVKTLRELIFQLI